VTLPDVVNLFPTDEKCRELLVRLRWPEGPQCLRCKGSVVELATAKQIFYCKDCDYQFSVTAGTVFNDSHLPLTKWFFATLLLCEARKGMSANQMKRTLGVSYKTAWYLMHRIRAAMKEVNPLPLAGTVEMDETYVGGKKHGACIRGRGAQKEVVIGIRQRGGDLRFFHAANANSRTLTKYIQEHISGDVDVIVTDDFAAYPPAIKKSDIPYSRHKSINHSSRKYVEGDVHTNTVESAFSLLKRGIIGTWHRVSAKHLAAYLDEMCFRFNNRKNPYLFRDTMLRLLASPNVEYKELTAA